MSEGALFLGKNNTSKIHKEFAQDELLRQASLVLRTQNQCVNAKSLPFLGALEMNHELGTGLPYVTLTKVEIRGELFGFPFS